MRHFDILPTKPFFQKVLDCLLQFSLSTINFCLCFFRKIEDMKYMENISLNHKKASKIHAKQEKKSPKFPQDSKKDDFLAALCCAKAFLLPVDWMAK